MPKCTHGFALGITEPGGQAVSVHTQMEVTGVGAHGFGRDLTWRHGGDREHVAREHDVHGTLHRGAVLGLREEHFAATGRGG